MSSLEMGMPILQAHRPPPPPPPPAQSDSPVHIESISTPYEIISGLTPSFSDIVNEPTEEVGEKCPLLLFEFDALFEKFDYASIREQILTRRMTTSPFTTVLWRIFLHCLPRAFDQWEKTIDLSREHYEDLVDKFYVDEKKVREINHVDDKNHPLSQEDRSLWCQYHEYKGLRDNIDQDVKRTCQEIEFFRQQHILDLLLKILFIHSRAYEQTLPYRQGMHEILAVIVYSVYMEGEIINEYPESNELMKKLYDPKYLAHDSYAMYQKVMTHLHLYYDFKQISTPQPRTNDKTIKASRRASIEPFHINKTIQEVNKIYDRLQYYDQDLYWKLRELSIEPTVYGLRWLRLLFGREIPFESIPTLWTVIFCYDEKLGFVDYIFLALLKRIGEIFAKQSVAEYSCCLQYLMQANVITDVEGIIRKALSFERTDFQKPRAKIDAQLMGDSMIQSGNHGLRSPAGTVSRNPLIDPPGRGYSLTLSQSSKDAEMIDSPGRENLQRMDGNIQIQRRCANFIHRFIERLRRALRKNGVPDDDQANNVLDALNQIADILEGKQKFDGNELEDILSYYEEKLNENVLTETV